MNRFISRLVIVVIAVTVIATCFCYRQTILTQGLYRIVAQKELGIIGTGLNVSIKFLRWSRDGGSNTTKQSDRLDCGALLECLDQVVLLPDGSVW